MWSLRLLVVFPLLLEGGTGQDRGLWPAYSRSATEVQLMPVVHVCSFM